MSNTSKIIVGLIVSLGFSSSLFARGGMGMPPLPPLDEAMAQYDTNQDGFLSQTEMQAARSAEFKQADTNADGVLDLTELETQMDNQHAKQLADRYADLDADSNGQISLEEFKNTGPQAQNTTSATNLFNLADQDHNGALSEEEFTTLESKEGHMWKHFTNLDSDGDGKISETEYNTTRPFGHHGGGPRGGRH